jgi:hypothetical protein
MTKNNRFLRSKFSYSNVMATVAVFFALGGAGAVAATHLGRNSVGSAQLQASAVTGAKVKDGSLSGRDVKASTLGQVPSAAHADSAGHADSAATADRAGTAQRADSATHADAATRADSAGHADTAGRAESAAHADLATHADSAASAETAAVASALTPLEAVHFLDAPGEPKSIALFTIGAPPVGFYRDHEGIVHLQGRLTQNGEIGGALFKLPAAYLPAQPELFYVPTAKGAVTKVETDATGFVEIYGPKTETISLDGISWRAAS